MDKTEKDMIKKEIEYLSKRLELDKFHYKRSMSNFIAKITPLITLFAGLVYFFKDNTTSKINTLLFLCIVLLVLLAILFYEDYKGQIGDYKEDIWARRKSIKRAYADLGVDMEKLDNEFEKFGGKHLNN